MTYQCVKKMVVSSLFGDAKDIHWMKLSESGKDVVQIVVLPTPGEGIKESVITSIGDFDAKQEQLRKDLEDALFGAMKAYKVYPQIEGRQYAVDLIAEKCRDRLVRAAMLCVAEYALSHSDDFDPERPLELIADGFENITAHVPYKVSIAIILPPLKRTFSTVHRSREYASRMIGLFFDLAQNIDVKLGMFKPIYEQSKRSTDAYTALREAGDKKKSTKQKKTSAGTAPPSSSSVASSPAKPAKGKEKPKEVVAPAPSTSAAASAPAPAATQEKETKKQKADSEPPVEEQPQPKKARVSKPGSSAAAAALSSSAEVAAAATETKPVPSASTNPTVRTLIEEERIRTMVEKETSMQQHSQSQTCDSSSSSSSSSAAAASTAAKQQSTPIQTGVQSVSASESTLNLAKKLSLNSKILKPTISPKKPLPAVPEQAPATVAPYDEAPACAQPPDEQATLKHKKTREMEAIVREHYVDRMSEEPPQNGGAPDTTPRRREYPESVSKAIENANDMRHTVEKRLGEFKSIPIEDVKDAEVRVKALMDALVEFQLSAKNVYPLYELPVPRSARRTIESNQRILTDILARSLECSSSLMISLLRTSKEEKENNKESISKLIEHPLSQITFYTERILEMYQESINCKLQLLDDILAVADGSEELQQYLSKI